MLLLLFFVGRMFLSQWATAIGRGSKILKIVLFSERIFHCISVTVKMTHSIILAYPTIKELQYNISEDGSLTVSGRTQGSPPTLTTWYRDGIRLDIDKDSNLDMEITVTNRSSSSFNVALKIHHPTIDANGNYYIFQMFNRYGSASKTVRVLNKGKY